MKKKIFSLLIVFGMFFTLLFTVKAYTAKVPSSIPSSGTDVYGIVDESFDFSKVTFTTADGGTTNGKNDIKKIRLSSQYSLETTDGDSKIALSGDWFSAYCLDPTLTYPDSGLVHQLTISNNAQHLFTVSLLTALKNQANSSAPMYDLLANLRGLIFSEAEVGVPAEYMEGETVKYEDLVNALYNSGTTSITVNVRKLTYISASSNPTITEITGSQLNNAAGNTGDEYQINLTRDDILFNKYRAVAMSNSTVNYNWALWIIEHSYPTLTMDRMFADIGVSKETLTQQLLTLEGLSNATESEANALVENYVYATIQYAVWKSTGSKVNNVTLGNELQGSTELNKIYKYLTTSRDYSNYGSETFAAKLTLNKPSNKTEIAEETKTEIKYGPYSYSSSLLTTSKINLTVSNTGSTKILNESGVEISSVKENEKFYILIQKSNAATEISVGATTEGGYTFEPSSNRGRVYYAHDPLTQTVGTGGIIKAATANHSFNILVNPKTGIGNNLAIVFILSLLIFSVGYMLIVFKNRPVEL